MDLTHHRMSEYAAQSLISCSDIVPHESYTLNLHDRVGRSALALIGGTRYCRRQLVWSMSTYLGLVQLGTNLRVQINGIFTTDIDKNLEKQQQVSANLSS